MSSAARDCPDLLMSSTDGSETSGIKSQWDRTCVKWEILCSYVFKTVALSVWPETCFDLCLLGPYRVGQKRH